ncbi:DUF192 domain-containing protein [Ammoniphilus sp. 3BR4]|uniref:DUF192 domain-containing protein n=1 Tax=Ammoniphilus sp. 3BR4 TaxID=3158265 RepID=UPI0034659EC6
MAVHKFRYVKIDKKEESSIDLHLAFTFWSRFWGLMGKKNTHLGMIFNRTNQVHMFFMRFPIDVYYLDKEGTVIHIVRSLKPWRISPRIKEAYFIIEFPAGYETQINLRDKFHL